MSNQIKIQLSASPASIPADIVNRQLLRPGRGLDAIKGKDGYEIKIHNTTYVIGFDEASEVSEHVDPDAIRPPKPEDLKAEEKKNLRKTPPAVKVVTGPEKKAPAAKPPKPLTGKAKKAADKAAKLAEKNAAGAKTGDGKNATDDFVET